MDLQIRRMEKEDIESCTELFIQAFAREPWKENHEALAVCIGMSKPWMKGIEYYLDLLCVDWRWQGKGIGSLFLEKVQQELEKDGIHGVLLSTERKEQCQNPIIRSCRDRWLKDFSSTTRNR